jgi:Protease inhibitor Inh
MESNSRSRIKIVLAMLVLAGALSGTARAWDQISPSVAREAAECVSWAPGRIDCFTRTQSGSLSWFAQFNGTWSGPGDLGGALAAAPSCVARGPGGLHCFAISAKGVLATISLNGNVWSKWSSLGGDLLPSRPSCVTLARDRIACFARARQGQLMMRRWMGGKKWDPWRNLGGAFSADPDCLAVNSEGAACFGRSMNGELIAYMPDPTGRQGDWAALGGRIEGRPTCVRLRTGDAACVAKSRSGRLHMWRGIPSNARSAGITTSSDDVTMDEPSCALVGGDLVCFYRNAQQRLVRRGMGNSVDSSRDGILNAPPVAALACLSFAPDKIGCLITDAEQRLQFAAGPKLEAGSASNPATAADEQAGGEWYLSNLQNGRACRVELLPDLAYGGKRLRIRQACNRVGLPARPAQWDQDENELLFLTADGRSLVRFHSTRAGRWISPRREAAFLLTREPPEQTGEASTLVDAPPANTASRTDESGAWRVVVDGAGILCAIRLSDARAGPGFAAHLDPACGTRISGVRYWSKSGSALVFVGAGEIVIARFEPAGPGKWRARDLGGLTLIR